MKHFDSRHFPFGPNHKKIIKGSQKANIYACQNKFSEFTTSPGPRRIQGTTRTTLNLPRAFTF